LDPGGHRRWLKTGKKTKFLGFYIIKSSILEGIFGFFLE